jgi:hypothetical protein
MSHWDDELDDWHQTDPPATAQEKRIEDAVERGAEAIETRTLVASSGKLIRAEFEQTMLDWADRLDVECIIIEHPHLLQHKWASLSLVQDVSLTSSHKDSPPRHK